MFLVGIFQWWYGRGWLKHLNKSYIGVLRVADFFSIGLLLKTLFNPFKQISAGSSQGPMPVQLAAFFDRLFSRVFGGFVRSLTILIGIVAIACSSVWMACKVILWTLLPLTPVGGIILWLSGVVL